MLLAIDVGDSNIVMGLYRLAKGAQTRFWA